MQCQRVHRSLQLRSERRIHLLVPGHPGTTVESRADQDHPKVCFRVGWHTVLVTFIGNVQEYWRKTALQSLLYVLLHCHEKPARDYTKNYGERIIAKVYQR